MDSTSDKNTKDVTVTKKRKASDTICTGIESPGPNVNSTATIYTGLQASTSNLQSRHSSSGAMGLEFSASGTELEYDGKNRCIICKVDMGECNPRQYCRKTYCENEPIEPGE